MSAMGGKLPLARIGSGPRKQMPGPHDRIIADAAKGALAPFGFRRKGRSRTWLADHGWWLTVVEFQPSRWSKGSYLNVAAHWLWSGMDHISFDFGGRVAEFVEYQSDAQFAPVAARLAESAADEAQRLSQTFGSLSATADILLNDARTEGPHGLGHPVWRAYNAGVVAGLVGRTGDAIEMFGRIQSSPAPPSSVVHLAADHMAKLAAEPSGMRREVSSLIARRREELRLPALDAPPF
jgi:hypothetical protein